LANEAWVYCSKLISPSWNLPNNSPCVVRECVNLRKAFFLLVIRISKAVKASLYLFRIY
jgi:hypothetical protein